MTLNTVAAVIPVYNKEPYVARAIRSVLDQTRPVDEIIIVDDGSTDGSREQIALFRDSRIRVLEQPTRSSGGPSQARNRGIRAASSTWIAFLDADDAWYPHFMAEVDAICAQAGDEIGCVFTGWHNIWGNGSITQDRYSSRSGQPALKRLDLDGFIADWIALRSSPMWTSATVITREVLQRAGMFPERCRQGEDKDTWLRVMALTEAARSSRPCSAYYRSIGTQITRTCSMNVRHCLCPTLERMIRQTSGRRRRLLMRLFNFEVFDYAVRVDQKEHISPENYRGFHVWLNPGRYCALLALTYLPMSLQRFIRSCALRVNAVWGKPRSAWHAEASETP